MKLEMAVMAAKERQAHDEADAAIEAAKNKYHQARQAGNIRMFIEWVNETYVPADKRKALPEQQDGLKGQVKFARWIVGNVCKSIHPDKYVYAPKAKYIEMEEVASLVNFSVNYLKGFN